jgi:segregation and condensation protein B
MLAAPRATALSRAALEVLAIVAFRQPVTRAAVDEFRGVHSEGGLATLMERGLVLEVGRADGPGRPILYGTSRRFLEQFGLRSLEDLAHLEAAGTAEAPLPLLHQPEAGGQGAAL